MSTSKLESLPQELIAHIATFVEALSIVHLSRTSKTIRNACWDSLIFKQVVQNSQRLNWNDDSLDLDAIAKQAGTAISTWARYAVADDQAWVLAGMDHPLSSPGRSISFLPGLAVVKHPFLKQSCWATATHGAFDYRPSHVFGLAMSILSADERSLSRFHDPGPCASCYPKPRENDPAFLSGEGALWTLCSVAITIHRALKTRRSVWPYNDAANVPYIDCPRAQHIPLRPLSETYGLPLPFSHRAEQLLNSLVPTSGGWTDWYKQHTQTLTISPDFLTTGTWCGYYTPNTAQLPLDPPMTGIRFQRNDRRSAQNDKRSLVWANGCLDGVGKFLLRGRLSWDGNVAALEAEKRYEMGLSWEWDCRVTPFGIVGHWGREDVRAFEPFGYVWLWKEEWTSERGE